MYSTIVSILIALVRIFVPAFFREHTSEDSAPQPEIRRRLHKRIRQTWGVPILLLCLIPLSGCSLSFGKPVKTVYVPYGEPVRIRQTQHDVPVWIKDKSGNVIEGEVDLAAGWYALPLEFENSPLREPVIPELPPAVNKQ